MAEMVFIGYTTRTRTTADKYLPEIKVPSNYKDETKIAEYIERASRKQLDEAGSGALTGKISMIAMLNAAGEELPALNRDETILERIGTFGSIICCGVDDLLNLAVIDQIERRGKLLFTQQWATRNMFMFSRLGSPEFSRFIVDPIKALRVQDYSAAQVADFFDINLPAGRGVAFYEANLALQLSHRLGIIG